MVSADLGHGDAQGRSHPRDGAIRQRPLEHRIRVLPNDFVAWPEDLKRSINPKLRGKLSISIVQQATEFLALQSTKPVPEVEQQPPIDSPVPAVRWKRGGFHGFRCLTCGSETRIIPGDPHHVYCPTCDQTYRCREDNFTKISWEDGYVRTGLITT